MRIKLLITALACIFFASAQEVGIVSHRQLLKGTEQGIYNPIISADGSKVLFTSDNLCGLKLYDFNDNVTLRITNAEMAGFEPAFSRDGGSVYFLHQTRDNQRAFRSIEVYDISSRTTEEAVTKQRGMIPPVAVSGGLMAVSDSGSKLKASAESGLAVYAKGATLVVCRNGKETVLSPVETPYTYLWASLSPDATKILFYAGARGAYICDLQGNLLSSLGKVMCPRWAGNDYVVAECSTSDGHQYETSQIVLLAADGSMRKDLTRPESMAMSPSASADGSRIVYSTIDGRLFVMDISIK